MQEADRDQLVVLPVDRFQNSLQRLLIERHFDRAVGKHALAQLEEVPAAHQGHWLGEVHVVGVVALLTANDDNVAEALRSN